MLPVRPTETVGIIFGQVFLNRLEVIGRDDAVRVEKDQIISFRMLHPDVAGIATSGVCLDDIVDGQFRAESLDFGRAG